MRISELKPGEEIPASSFTLTPDKIKDYVDAVEESSGYFTQHSHGAAVPPIACVGLAMSALLKDVEVPKGTIHLSQEIRLNRLARIGQALNCHGSLVQNQVRGHLRIITIRLEVNDEVGEEVLQGKTSLILSEQRNGVS